MIVSSLVPFTDTPLVELPGHFVVWAASSEADFLSGKFVWANFDVPELVEMREKIANSKLLEVELGGVSFEGWSITQAFPV